MNGNILGDVNEDITGVIKGPMSGCINRNTRGNY